MQRDPRVAVGGFGAESNVFSIERPGDDFAVIETGEQLLSSHRGKKTVIGGFLEALGKSDVEAVPTTKVWWGATGVITKDSYERSKDRMLSLIRSAGRLDGLLLDLHGAMMAENVPDAEGLLLKEIREIIGSRVPIVCVLDLHANMTDLKVQMTDAILGYRSNPHIDLYERGLKAGRLLTAMMRGEAKPVMRLKRLPMLGPNLGMSTWAYSPENEKRLPLASIMKKVAALEQEPGMLDITVFVGFAWSDIPECVTSILAISDNKPALAEKVADRVASMVWDARRDFIKLRPLIPADEAVDRAMKASEGPIVLVDVADNSGGGGPCDNTVILEALLRKGAEDAVVPLRDTDAVSKAFKLGVGSVIKLEVGGKIDTRFYKPVKVEARVKALSDGVYALRGPSHGGVGKQRVTGRGLREVTVGRMALLKTRGVEIIVSEGRVGMERDYYKAATVDPAERKIVVVKSAQAHRAAFEGIAKEIIEVDTPGATSPSYRGLTFKNVPRPIFPLDSL